ncbi:hypothetical protein [Melittangium boletus]|uniref:hypothetical protein n=1 Tax=Melittangium boletus TaxID=83453 RepID=UPI003DA3F742
MSRGVLLALLGGVLTAGGASGEGPAPSAPKAPPKAASSAAAGKQPAAKPAPSAAPTKADWQELVRDAITPSQDAPPPEDPDPFGFSVYRGARPEPMGEQTLINGARMQIATLIVDDAPHIVMNNYADSLEKQGVVNVMVGKVPEVKLMYMSFRPPGSDNLKTLTFVPHGSGTVILASVGNPEELLERKNLPDGLPQPPNSEPPTAMQQLEPGLSSRSAFFLVKDSTPAKVMTFYRTELLKRGYVPTPEGESLPGMESYQKAGSVLSITAKVEDSSGVAVSLVWFDS